MPLFIALFACCITAGFSYFAEFQLEFSYFSQLAALGGMLDESVLPQGAAFGLMLISFTLFAYLCACFASGLVFFGSRGER